MKYDPYTDSFVDDKVDLNSYMLGYLKGCEDTIKKVNELNTMRISYTYPYSKNSSTDGRPYNDH